MALYRAQNPVDFEKPSKETKLNGDVLSDDDEDECNSIEAKKSAPTLLDQPLSWEDALKNSFKSSD